MSTTFEIKEEKEVKTLEKEEKKPDDSPVSDSVKIQFIGKDKNLNDFITAWKNENLIKAIFSDDFEFITTEDGFKKIEKKFKLENVEFDVNIQADGDKTNIPSFILEKAGIAKGDKIVFEIGEDNTVKLKKIE